MRVFIDILIDESGSILSAEAVAVGTVLLVGTTTGMNAVNQSIQSELSDFASAIHELDQSYAVERVQLGNSWNAGSSFQDDEASTSINNAVNQNTCIEFDQEIQASDSKPNTVDDLDKIELDFIRKSEE